MKVAIYARVSTDGQELEQQLMACQRFCDFKQFTVARVYSEIVSGAKSKRPQYLAMLNDLRAHKYDGVVVFRLDRLGRNSRELALLIDELENKDIKVLSVCESFDTSNAIGRAMREIIIVFAQLEREQIGEATKQRLSALKAMGKRLGRKPLTRNQVATIRTMRAVEKLSIPKIAKRTSVSFGTVHAVINNRGVYADTQKYPNI